MKDIKTIKISKAAKEDAEGIQILTAKSSEGMYKLCGWSKDEIEKHFSPEKIKDGTNKLRNAISNFTENDILFVAKNETNQIVGCCFADKGKDINKIEAVYLLDEYQGSGLAKRLYNEALKFLNPITDTYLDVFSLNTKAVNFYKKMGFCETGKKFFDDRFIDESGKSLEITEMKLETN